MEKPQTNKATSLLVGGTGLVGRSVLDSLINKNQTIVLLTRRRIQQLPSNVQQHVIDFDSLANDTVLPYSSHVYICLGSTMKQAGNKDHFKMVDLDYVVSVAKLALKSGASRLSIISSVGANPKSIFFYTKI